MNIFSLCTRVVLCYCVLLPWDASCVLVRYHKKIEARWLIRTQAKECLVNSDLLKSRLIITVLIINSLLLYCIVICFQWEWMFLELLLYRSYAGRTVLFIAKKIQKPGLITSFSPTKLSLKFTLNWTASAENYFLLLICM